MTAENSSTKTAQNLAVIVSALCEIGTAKAGEAIGRDHSFIVRLRKNDTKCTLEEFCQLLSLTNLEVLEAAQDQITIERQLHDSLTYLAQRGLKGMSVEQS